MFILLIDIDDDTRSVVFNDLSLHDNFLYTNHNVLKANLHGQVLQGLKAPYEIPFITIALLCVLIRKRN
jgi:hypothetical protein